MARLFTKIIVVSTVLVLTGCATVSVPVARQFPEAPPELMTECGNLDLIGKQEVKLSELMTTVTKNYTRYHKCAELTSAWQEWYKDQKQIFESVK
jgi:hypothetical protein